MDVLLLAMQRSQEFLVNILACELFITQDDLCNRAQVDEFEKYAPCRIDIFGYNDQKREEPFGVIRYNNKIFKFGYGENTK